MWTPETVYCVFFDCPSGYTLIGDADEEECKNGKCEKSKCCQTVCSSYDCPKHYELVDDADDVVCKDNKCTKDQCCEKGERRSGYTRQVSIVYVSCHTWRSSLLIEYFYWLPQASQRYAESWYGWSAPRCTYCSLLGELCTSPNNCFWRETKLLNSQSCGLSPQGKLLQHKTELWSRLS